LGVATRLPAKTAAINRAGGGWNYIPSGNARTIELITFVIANT
jgi:hypothetical protein